MPAGVRFVGWHIGAPAENESPNVVDGETLLAAGTSYTVTGNVSLTSRFNTFDVFTTAGDWNVESNWSWGLPDGEKEIVIAAAATIPNGCIADVGNNLTLDLEGTITIADGGQLKTSNAVDVTVQKNIAAWTTNPVGGWYFIASPINSDTLKPNNNAIAPCTGVIVEAASDQEYITFSTTAPCRPPRRGYLRGACRLP